jgi:hypothetical protein
VSAEKAEMLDGGSEDWKACYHFLTYTSILNQEYDFEPFSYSADLPPLTRRPFTPVTYRSGLNISYGLFMSCRVLQLAAPSTTATCSHKSFASKNHHWDAATQY